MKRLFFLLLLLIFPLFATTSTIIKLEIKRVKAGFCVAI